MARFKVSPNLEKYNQKIYALGYKSTEFIMEAVKLGANPVADAVRANLNAIPTDDSYKKKARCVLACEAFKKSDYSKV